MQHNFMKNIHITIGYLGMSKFLNQVIDVSQRRVGKTMILDRLAYQPDILFPLDPAFASCVKIGWGIPYLLDRKVLMQRVSAYRDHGYDVSNGGTLLEMAYSKNRHIEAIKELNAVGFNAIEVSEGVLDIPDRVIEDMVGEIRSRDMKVVLEVGRKNSLNQLSLDETIDRSKRLLDYDPDMLIIEGRETGKNVEIFDANGSIKWDWVNRLVKNLDRSKVMFEAPIEAQQAELVIKLGPEVNLGNVSMGSAFALATQRLGLRGDTFGIEEFPEDYHGSPASRFILHILVTRGPMDQLKIMEVTGMNRRTVQNALDSLLTRNMIKATNDLRDMRKKVYSLRTIPV